MYYITQLHLQAPMQGPFEKFSLVGNNISSHHQYSLHEVK